MPYDSAVEVSGVVTGHGFEPYNWGRFENAGARGDLQSMKGMEEMAIKAAIHGDYGAALQAFTVNPLIPGGAVAKRLLDEMLYAHKEYLPQFADKIKEIEEKDKDVVNYVDELMQSN